MTQLPHLNRGVSAWLQAGVFLLALNGLSCRPAQSQSPTEPAAAPAAQAPAAQPSVDGSANSLWTRATGSDWPQFLGPTGDSKSTEKGLVWGEQGPPVVWTTELGESYGACSVSRGRVYAFDRVGDQARLRCLHAETGKLLWKFAYATDYRDLYNYNGGPRCSPLIDGDRCYLFGVEGMLYCLNALTGEEVWQVDTAKTYGVVQNFFGVGSNPVIDGELLIVMVGGSPERSQFVPPGRLDRVVGNGSGFVAFDKRTGKEKYRITDELASYASLKRAEIAGRPWILGFARGGLVGFEPQSGKVDFQFPWRAESLESVNASMPVVVGDHVLISETYGPGSALLQVAPGKHAVLWQDDPRKRAKALQTHWNTPVHVDGYVYASSGRHEGNAELRCVEWKTGEVQWSQPGLTRSSLLYVDGHFVCQCEDGALRLLRVNPRKFEQVGAVIPTDPNGGAQLLTPPAWAAPVLAHGLLYVRGDDRLVCLELIPNQ